MSLTPQTPRVSQIDLVLPIMIAVCISKLVGDVFTDSLYNVHISLSGVPMLGIEWVLPHKTFYGRLNAKSIMQTAVVCLPDAMAPQRIEHVLKTTTHGTFPLTTYDHMGSRRLFHGLVSRYKLEQLIRAEHEKGVAVARTSADHSQENEDTSRSASPKLRSTSPKLRSTSPQVRSKSPQLRSSPKMKAAAPAATVSPSATWLPPLAALPPAATASMPPLPPALSAVAPGLVASSRSPYSKRDASPGDPLRVSGPSRSPFWAGRDSSPTLSSQNPNGQRASDSSFPPRRPIRRLTAPPAVLHDSFMKVQKGSPLTSRVGQVVTSTQMTRAQANAFEGVEKHADSPSQKRRPSASTAGLVDLRPHCDRSPFIVNENAGNYPDIGGSDDVVVGGFGL